MKKNFIQLPGYLALSIYRVKRGDWRGASKNYQHLLSALPGNRGLQLKLVDALFKSKQYERVLTRIEEFYPLENNDIRAAQLKASSLIKIAEYDAAIEAVRFAELRFKPSYELTVTEADATLAKADYGAALSMYESALNLARDKQDMSYVNHSLGYIYERTDRYAEATNYYNQAVSLSPHRGVRDLGIGYLHYVRGFNDLAIQAYKKEQVTKPCNAELHFQKGKVYSRLLKTSAAAESYSNFVKYDEHLISEGHRLNEKMIVFDAYMSRNYSCSPRAIYETMLKDPKYRDFTFVWMMRSSSITRFWRLYLNPRTKVVKYKTRDYFRYYAKAKYWVTNSRIPFVLKFDSRQVYVQCWHGTPLKKMGHSVVGKSKSSKYDKDGLAELYDHETKRFDYFVSPSSAASGFFEKAFAMKELKKERILVETGYPRNDILKNFDSRDCNKIKRINNFPKDKKLLLYAPTWRDDQHDPERGYTYKNEIDFDYLQEKLGDEWAILFRAHYFVANSFDFNKYEGFIYNVSDVNDVNDLYIVSDALMTDYSSVFFDYANLNRPIIFFMYDLEHYAKDLRGFYINLDELPGSILKEEEGIIDVLKNLDSYMKMHEVSYSKFNRRFNYLDDGSATQRLLDIVI